MSLTKMTVERPKIEDRNFTKPLMCGPGPCDITPAVSEALTRPVVSAMCDEYFNAMDDIRAGLQYLFQTRSKLVLAISGSGHAGMETVICNLLSPRDTLLIASRGIWDERAKIISTRYGIKAIPMQIPFTATFSLDQIEAGLKKYRPTALFITHGDSSTGTVQNLEGIGDLCQKYGAFLLVDTVVSIGGVPFFMDAWKVDAVYTSSQKALSAPAGITPVAFSARAEERINKREHEPPFYFDVKILAQQWNCHGNTRLYHHTLSPPLVWALRCSLKEISEETLEKSWERHTNTMVHFHKRLQEMGFKFLIPKPEDRLPTVTTVVLPPGYDYLAFVKYMVKKHNILIFAGLGPTKGKALRIGTMGINSTIQVADALADAMTDTLKNLTKSSL
ncbi:serine--pyruvate aminotransferase, mitochondrial-like [Aricia agestis]|uniref:serine--pyruvate aminotransferase, mitochondrial-like n=1 Tax=Aricia agestis TaxID=91739 RepID=UPI001C208010|nr:serine--pyruvate aminotransferase, mitochondrial-like [Aricia agestis]XP_041979102.1 serine--pyruvate aminotransferase, mitochondrial-like [Aricia agestis]